MEVNVKIDAAHRRADFRIECKESLNVP